MDLDLRRPETFAHWTPVTLRFSDEDRLGHINNAAYVVWFEASRVMFISQFLADAGDLDTVLARIEVDFVQETRFPGDVRIGACLLAVGRKSFRSGYGIFRDGQCLATAECVNVFFDPKERRSVAPPASVHDALSALLPTAR